MNSWMNISLFIVILSFSLLIFESYSFRGFLKPILRRTALSSIENGVTLASLIDIQSDGIFLSDSIKLYLDTEYISLPIHKAIGEAVKDIYIKERLNGVVDLGELLMCIRFVPRLRN